MKRGDRVLLGLAVMLQNKEADGGGEATFATPKRINFCSQVIDCTTFVAGDITKRIPKRIL